MSGLQQIINSRDLQIKELKEIINEQQNVIAILEDKLSIAELEVDILQQGVAYGKNGKEN